MAVWQVCLRAVRIQRAVPDPVKKPPVTLPPQFTPSPDNAGNNSRALIFMAPQLVRDKVSGMPSGESAAHRELKRLSLVWAQANGYSVAACEVSIPNLRFRLDAAGYRPGSAKQIRQDEITGRKRSVPIPTLGLSAVFECKATRADLVRDCRKSAHLIGRMQELSATRLELEQHLRIACPSLLKGDSLWPEYETAAFERSDHPPYLKVVKTLAMLSRQLHGQTKMENLFKWNAANLHYLVVEPGTVAEHEIPVGWGLLVREEKRLILRVRPEFREVPAERQLGFLHRIAAAATKSVNREMAVDIASIEAERRGLPPPEPITETTPEAPGQHPGADPLP